MLLSLTYNNKRKLWDALLLYWWDSVEVVLIKVELYSWTYCIICYNYLNLKVRWRFFFSFLFAHGWVENSKNFLVVVYSFWVNPTVVRNNYQLQSTIYISEQLSTPFYYVSEWLSTSMFSTSHNLLGNKVLSFYSSVMLCDYIISSSFRKKGEWFRY